MLEGRLASASRVPRGGSAAGSSQPSIKDGLQDILILPGTRPDRATLSPRFSKGEDGQRKGEAGLLIRCRRSCSLGHGLGSSREGDAHCPPRPCNCCSRRGARCSEIHEPWYAAPPRISELTRSNSSCEL